MQRIKRRLMLAVIALVGSALAHGCGSGTAVVPPPPPPAPVSNLAPTLTSLSPTSALVQGTSFILTLNGSNFAASTVVIWNGTLLPTSLVSSQQVTTTISGLMIASTGIISVAVQNVNFSPTASIPFPINNPAPVISSLSPANVSAGAAPLFLTVNGSNYVGGATVLVNGTARPSTNNGTQLMTKFCASDVAAAGSFTLTIVNPDPAVGPSNEVTFNVIPLTSNPAPTLTTSLDTTVPAGWPGFLLTVEGTKFVEASVLTWNGVNQATTVNSSTELQAAIPANEINSAGSSQVAVVNPSPGGGSSGSLPITIQTVPPSAVGVIETSNIGNDFSAPDGRSDSGAVSGDGRFVVFESSADNLVPGENLVAPNTYLRDTCLGAPTGCVPSVTEILTGSSVEWTSISANGRYVGISASSNAFEYDTCFNAALGCVPSASPIDPASTLERGEISLSADGRFATYVEGSPFCDDFSCVLIGQVFFVDTCAGAAPGCMPSSQMISEEVPAFNESARDATIHPYISPDGRFVTFSSSDHDVQFYDSCQGAPASCSPSTTLLSVATDGSSPANAPTFGGSISSGGRYVAFISKASNLVPGIPDTTVLRIYLRDTCIGAPAGCIPTTTLVDVVGDQAAEDPPSMSADARYIAFGSEVTDLVPGDTNDMTDVFVQDTCIGVTSGCTPSVVRVSVGLDGTQGNSFSHRPVISSDGHYVVFGTQSKLGPGTTSAFPDMIYLARH